MVEPMIVSHGWRDGATYQERHTWQGTRDLCAFLSVPAAIEFQRQHDWDEVRHAATLSPARRVGERPSCSTCRR